MSVWMEGAEVGFGRQEIWKKIQEEIYGCSERGRGALYKHASHTGFHMIPILLLDHLPPNVPSNPPFSWFTHRCRRALSSTCAHRFGEDICVLSELRLTALIMTDVGKLTLQCNSSEGLALATTKGRA